MKVQETQTHKTLEEVQPGEKGTILQVGNDRGPVKRRLVDMGLTPGTQVMVRKVAPFGDPVELNLRGYELSLRKSDAAQILIATGEEGERKAQARKSAWAWCSTCPMRRLSAGWMPTTPMRRRPTAACPTTPATTPGR